THLTGLFTDFGIHLGMRLRGHRVEGWKLLIPVCITLAFLIGAAAGAFVVSNDRGSWLFLAGAGYLVGGVSWSVYKRVGNPGPRRT
ncbi:MAG: DUF1275 family protein, partial [Verrucomicrobiae bacterium]|nr:DUF1275 family protein [Verrucomicrobiae bacterium]